jgi:hypothetical protein
MIYNYTDTLNPGTEPPNQYLGSFIRFGDFKSTGFPSGFATFWSPASLYQPAAYFIENIPCSGSGCALLEVSNKRMLYFDENPNNINGLERLS